LSQALSMLRGRNRKDLGPSGFCNLRIGFSQAPEHVEGEGL
jgi:hypothetical protein